MSDVTVDDGSIRAEITTTGTARCFITTPRFEAEYTAVSECPEGIAAIPVVASLCAAVWSNDLTLRVGELDAAFAECITDLRRAYASLYPEIDWSGTVDVEHRVDYDERNRNCRGHGSLLLFSGGVDSLASYLGHRDESPVLLSVHGSDVDVENESGWASVEQQIDEFVADTGAEAVTVRSNLRKILDVPLLQSYHNHAIEGGWWGGVQHGPALLGHCAPVAFSCGLPTVHIAATHTADFDPAWGSHPDLDEAIRWTGTTVNHDGYELSRQEKLERIIEYSNETDHYPTIRTCYESESGRNCGRCEKCCRTVLGLTLAGADPQRYGFPVSGSIFDHIRSRLEQGDWVLGDDEEYMWQDLQENVPEPVPESRPLREFLQ